MIKSFFRNKNLNKNKNLKDKFSKIYFQNIFGGKDSRSGGGSNMEQTLEIRNKLPKLIKEFGIKSFIDAPCGDFFWMRETKLGVKRYIGIDIVESLIQSNQYKFGDSVNSFVCMNLIDENVPKADLVFCRDCLVHLTYEDIQKVILNFKISGAKYILTTTFSDRDANVDLIGNDIWRPLNLERSPFNFPTPLKIINEKCTEGSNQFTDKSLGLWRLADIKTSW